MVKTSRREVIYCNKISSLEKVWKVRCALHCNSWLPNEVFQTHDVATRLRPENECHHGRLFVLRRGCSILRVWHRIHGRRAASNYVSSAGQRGIDPSKIAANVPNCSIVQEHSWSELRWNENRLVVVRRFEIECMPQHTPYWEMRVLWNLFAPFISSNTFCPK